LQNEILSLGKNALKASRELSLLDSQTKNNILLTMADEIDRQKDYIQKENKKDLIAGKENGLSKAMLDRLELTDTRISGMSGAIREVAELPDPVGEIIKTIERPNGLKINKIRVPIGVIGIIFESRPNVTADSASLCFKTSNAVILRGGKEAVNSNRAIVEALQQGGKKAGLPDNVIQLIQTTDRDAVRQLVQMEDYVNLIIPRGGEGLIRAVTEMAHVPVIKHYKGVCHTYVDKDARLQKALDIVVNAKCQRPGVCNAMETLLVHRDIAAEFLPLAAEKLMSLGVELRGNEEARKIVTSMKKASEDDWYEEYLDLILAVRVVPDIQTAVDHINTYGSQHSDAIITESADSRDKFFKEVDSATIYVNASTRFTDGGEFGMGAEIGISTDKLHARGPMGLEELTTYKYIIYGDGQIRE
jgi:glutamate-5-semialdehyde dehydrogenase